MGYDMLVGERGWLLSDGQRQAIALGRLLLVDRLIVLDQGRIAADGPNDKVLEDLQRKAKAAGQEAA